MTIYANKRVVQVKQGKTVFNVQNSISATGSNALELLQKSPGVAVDNNDNISIKGKTGVKIYVDGKMLHQGEPDSQDKFYLPLRKYQCKRCAAKAVGAGK